MVLAFRIDGIPVSQGNHRITRRHGRHPKLHETTKGHAAWRELVTVQARIAVRQHGWKLTEGPVVLELRFRLPRPTSHVRKDGKLRKGYPVEPVHKPDLSKLIRAVEDSLTDAGVWADDSQVVEIEACKRYEGNGRAGVDIYVRPVEDIW